jgi:hypothetical protein
VRARRRLLWLLALPALLLAGLAAAYWLSPRPVSLSPSRGAAGVSTRTEIRLRFSSPLAAPYPQLQLSPPVPGEQRYEGNTLIFVPAAPLAPGQSYTVSLVGEPAGARLPCLRCPSLRWPFSTAEPAILYLAWDAGDNPQLFRQAATGGAAQPLTAAPYGIGDYAVSPRGDRIVYSARRADGGSDLWLAGRSGNGARLLLACPAAACDGAAWAPDGRRLVFVRRLLQEEGSGPPRLHWLDADTGDNQPVFADEEQQGLFPRFSANGKWLAFVGPGPSAGVPASPLDGGAPQLLPGELAAPASWHPHEERFLSPVILYEGERTMIHLFEVAVSTRAIQDVSGDVASEDGGAVWSPDGEWIAFARRPARTMVGRQVWLMRPGGDEARPLTSDPDSNFSNLSWSPDGQTILAQRFAVGGQSSPEIWLIPVDGGAPVRVAPGILPAWLP